MPAVRRGGVKWEPPSPDYKLLERRLAAFNSLDESIASAIEQHPELGVSHMITDIAREEFIGAPSTHRDTNRWFRPTLLVRTVRSLVTYLASEHRQVYGLLIAELERVASSMSVTREFRYLTGLTYGELLQMLAVRYILEFLKDDLEVINVQADNIRLANISNRRTYRDLGQIDLRSYANAGPELELWDEMMSYWLNDADIAIRFRSI